MGLTPVQSAAGAVAGNPAAVPAVPASVDPALLEELWAGSGAESWALDRISFHAILNAVIAGQTFTGSGDELRRQQSEFFGSLKLPDLVLAQACARGHERAWEHFFAAYRQPLIRAATAITGSGTLGEELADQLYAELYGLNERDGERRCPLASYRGRGSLMGWLRTTLSQRHVDHHRRTRREEPLAEEMDPPAPEPQPIAAPAELSLLGKAVVRAIAARDAEEQFLLASYYLDGRTLAQIARLLNVHEATISRRVSRLVADLRKQVVRNLEQDGLSRRGAQEALGSDPRDLDLNLKNLLQHSQSGAFHEWRDSTGKVAS